MTYRVAGKGNPFQAANPIGLVEVDLGTETANAITATVTLRSPNNDVPITRVACEVYLSDDAAGGSIIATGLTSIAAGAKGFIMDRVSTKAVMIVSDANGQVELVLTYSGGAKTAYLAVVLPDGSIWVSDAIVWAA